MINSKKQGSIWTGHQGQFTPESRGSITTEEVGSVCSESPVAYKTAEIQVRNSNGKIIETLEVTNDFEFIYLPAEYNSGLYLYTLIVDGVIIKTEKVVLSK